MLSILIEAETKLAGKLMTRKIDLTQDFTVCMKTNSLDHLKKFWTKAFSVMNRVQKQWQCGIKKKEGTQEIVYFTKIRNMLSIYELLIVEFNEYCEVLEIQGLGKCILKMFIQMISIIETLIKSSFVHFNSKKQRVSFTNFKDMQLRKNNQNYQANSGGNQNRSEKTSKQNYFAEKQKNKFQVKQMEDDLNNFEQTNYAYSNPLQQRLMKKQRDKALNLEPSNAQFIIREAFLLIESKQNLLVNMMELRSHKLKLEEPKEFKKSAQICLDEIEKENKFVSNNTMHKLIQAVEKCIKNREHERKQKMVSVETQVLFKQQTVPLDKQKGEKFKKEMDRKDEEIKLLKSQLRSDGFKITALEKILKDKQENHENQMAKQRIALMKLEKRVSITSKMSRPSNVTMDFVTSEQTILKEQSDNRIDIERNMSKLMKRKIRQSNKLRQSYNEDRNSFGHGHSFSQFQGFNGRKNIQLGINNTTYEIRIIASNIKKDKQEAMSIIQCDGTTQTDQKQFKFKQARQKPKVVKFRTIFAIFQQYSLNLTGSKIEAGLKPNQVIFSAPEFSTLLRKKKGSVAWPKSRTFKTLNRITEQSDDVAALKRSFSKFEKYDLQDLFIGNDSKSVKDKNSQPQKINFTPHSKIPDEMDLNFRQQDLDGLFIRQEKALDFQFLSSNITAFKSKFSTKQIMKSQRCSSRSLSRPEIQQKHAHQNKGRPTSAYSSGVHSQVSDGVVLSMYRHLNLIKHSNLQKYQKIVNFIRYPYSIIYKIAPSSKALAQREEELRMEEIRKMMHRFDKLHHSCLKNPETKLCTHIESFMRKIGLTFVVKNTL